MRLRCVVWLVGLLCLSAACGGGGGDATSPGGGGGGGGGTTQPPAGTINIQASSFNPSAVTTTAGSTITWVNVSAIDHNVVFTPTKPPGGDIGTHSSGSNARTFTTAGSYTYTCTLHSFSGQLTVN